MKNFLVFVAMVASSYVMASVDYQRCQGVVGFMGPQLNDDGEFSKSANGMLPAPDVDTKKLENGGTRITYSYKMQGGPWNGGKPVVSHYMIEKDKDGKLSKIITGGEEVDKQQIKMQKQMMLEGAVYSGVPMGGLTNDPIVTVSLDAQGHYQTPLSKLDNAQAKLFGVDMDELRKLRSEKRKDTRTLNKLRGAYSKLIDKAPLMIPNGNEIEVEIKDGNCQVNKVSSRWYDPKSKQNTITGAVTRERCEAVNKISKKYEKQLQACMNTNFQMYQELSQGSDGGGIGGAVHGAAYGGGGIVGGSVGGIAGGSIGGMGVGSGMGGGYVGGYNPYQGGYAGDSFQCQMYFGERSEGGYVAGGYGGGSSSPSVKPLKQKAKNQ